MYKKVSVTFGERTLSLETGKLANQASGAVLVTYGDNIILVTAVSTDEIREGIDFVPITVNYQEKFYASGKIPGGFFKREGRPTDTETLNSRLIDRPIRPLFPKGWPYETQIIPTVLSADQDTNPGPLALVGASAALEISDIPFEGPVAAVHLGRLDGRFILFPTREQMQQSDLDLVVAGNRGGIVMVEGGARMASEEDILEALFFAHREMQPLLELQDRLREEIGKPKREFEARTVDAALREKVTALFQKPLEEALNLPTKVERHNRFHEAKRSALAALLAGEPALAEREGEIKAFFRELERDEVRRRVITSQKRLDGRGLADIRPIQCEVGILPRTHGSALFTRGETKALCVSTLGTREDEKLIERLEEEYYKTFYLHYNFQPYCVGETSNRLGPGRREMGHGMLAERALARVLPAHDDFPYTIRVVSDIMESNGSSSMATVCGGALSLMDAGVPIQAPVAGIAMGLIKESDDRFHVLSDIMGDEDHCGDMDFKVAGTAAGVTAIQMDIKVSGLTREILAQALRQAAAGRLFILQEMGKAIEKPRAELSRYAPRIVTIKIPVDKIKDVIGPGGKVIRSIIERTGATIDVADDGTIHVASVNGEKNEEALRLIRELTQEAEVGAVYRGKVRKIAEFGAFVEIFPGTDGLLHISELENRRVNKVTDVLHEGDEVVVKCLRVGDDGKISLSRKAVLELQPPSTRPRPEHSPRDEEEQDRQPRRRSAGGRGDRGPRPGGSNQDNQE
jgi:polyribonucleotide nucleotidyltransferase